MVAGLAAAGVLGAPSADAATRLKHDMAHETRFVLDGRELAVTVVDLPRYEQHPPTLKLLAGKEVRAACGTSFRRYALKTVAYSLGHWSAGDRSMRFTLSRDVSRAARWCLIEQWDDHGGDVAFVSFRKAEPPRLVARGMFDDGSAWRMVAWRGYRLEPCLRVRLPRTGGYGSCFEAQAEQEATLDSTAMAPLCEGESLLVGVVSRRASTVTVTLGDGSAVAAQLYRRPPGSKVRAQYFVAKLPREIDVERVVARDAAGGRVASERGRGMFGGFCDRG